MKVIHINSDYGNTIYKSLSDNLFKLGINQRVFKFVRPNKYPTENYDEYVDVRLNYKNIDRYIFHVKHKKVLSDFYRYLQDKEVDLLHAHTLFSNGYIAYKTYKKLGIPYIVTVRGTDISIFFKHMFFLRSTGINILKNASKIVFISHSHKETVFKEYIPNELKKELIKKVSIIPNGIDEIYYKKNKKNITINNDDINEKVVITAAWINENKNQLNVAKAIELLNNKGHKIKYKVIGGIEIPGTYNKLLEELKSFPFLEVVPRKNKQELLNEYQNADVFAMVSYNETFGLSYIEALTQGLPIIYTINQGIFGYFEEGKAGFASDPTSPKDISEKLEKVLSNDFKIANQSYLELEQFKWHNIAEKYKKIYTEMFRK